LYKWRNNHGVNGKYINTGQTPLSNRNIPRLRSKVPTAVFLDFFGMHKKNIIITYE